MTQTKYKRRTFKDVEAAGYAKGWSDGREAARVEFEQAYNLLSKHSSDTMAELLQVQSQLDNVSLRKLAWSRITGLFRSRHDRVA
jgi:flagellar biosynthesis/type III secretory pathway protein FliH